MEQQKPRLKFKANLPEDVELTFDEPKTGEGQYGEWFMYGCKHDGREKVFFPSKMLHTMIQMSGFKEGSKFTVLKNEGDDGKMFFTINGKTFGEIQEGKSSDADTKEDPLDEDIPF